MQAGVAGRGLEPDVLRAGEGFDLERVDVARGVLRVRRQRVRPLALKQREVHREQRHARLLVARVRLVGVPVEGRDDRKRLGAEGDGLVGDAARRRARPFGEQQGAAGRALRGGVCAEREQRRADTEPAREAAGKAGVALLCHTDSA